MNNCEEKIPTASSTPTPVVQDIRCYTIEDLMAMLLLSRPTVYRLLKQNEFRWFKVSGAYRISKASFEAWLNDGTVERNPAV
jgi:excisionase family DNA binding protein